MILVLSDEEEGTTDLVIEWLIRMDKAFVRLSYNMSIVILKLYINNNNEKLTIYQLKEKKNIPWSELKTELLFWKLSSHKNPICKHCEYHRVCIDNNIPQYVDRGTSFNKKYCIYNPFICKWEGEYGYIKSSFCGTYSDNDFILNTSYIKSTFNKLWNE